MSGKLEGKIALITGANRGLGKAMALALAVLFSVSAAEVAFDPVTGQSLITTLAILLFSVWVLWFGVMLVRLKPES